MKRIMKLMPIVLLCMSVIAGSCTGKDPIDEALNLSNPEISSSSVSPENGSSGVMARPEIYVDFPAEMDKPKTEEAFSISSDYGTPRGYFRWDGNRMYYDLIEDLRNGAVYTIRVSVSAEDVNGNNIREEILARFTVGNDFTKPRVLGATPGDGSNSVARNSAVQVTFSEPISLLSAEKGFSISPRVIGTKTLSADGQTLIFTPYSGFENKTSYTVVIGTDITDVAGNPLLAEVSFSFMVGGDFVLPTLDPAHTNSADATVGVFAVPAAGAPLRLDEGNLTAGVEKDSSFRIVFSKAMKPLETGDAIQLSPAPLNGFRITWTDDRTATISLTGNGIFELNRVYTLAINDSAIDTHDNRLDGAYTYPFQITGVGSLVIFVKDIRQMEWLPNVDPRLATVDESKPGRSLLTCYSIIDLGIYDPDDPASPGLEFWGYPQPINTVRRYVYIIRVYFQNSANNLQTTGVSWSAAQRAMQYGVERYHGTDDGHVVITPVIWKKSRPDAARNAIDLYIFDLEPSNYYRLKVDGGSDGMLDANGNYLETDFATLFDS